MKSAITNTKRGIMNEHLVNLAMDKKVHELAHCCALCCQYVRKAQRCTDKHTSVPNRRACSFISSKKKIPPSRPYFGLHVY